MPLFIFLNCETMLSMIQPFLEDQDNFGLTRDQTTKVILECHAIAVVLKIILIFISGYLYDILGRRSVITTILLAMGIIVIFVPYTSPNLTAL